MILPNRGPGVLRSALPRRWAAPAAACSQSVRSSHFSPLVSVAGVGTVPTPATFPFFACSCILNLPCGWPRRHSGRTRLNAPRAARTSTRGCSGVVFFFSYVQLVYAPAISPTTRKATWRKGCEMRIADRFDVCCLAGAMRASDCSTPFSMFAKAIDCDLNCRGF
jgi:hypothetical protein